MTALRSAPRTSLLLLLTCPALAYGAEPLVWKWEEGESRRYKMTQTMQMTIDAGPAGQMQTENQSTMSMVWKAKEVKPDGAAVVQQQVERAVMSMNAPMGQSMSYDTSSKEPPTGMAAMMAPMLDAMVSAPVLMTMKPTGEITDVKLPDEFDKAFKNLPGGVDMQSVVEQSTQQGFVAFPVEPIEVGHTWVREATVTTPQMGELVATSTFTYNGPKEVDGRQFESIGVKLDMAAGENGAPGQMDIDYETTASDGEILFDREAGRIVSSILQSDTDIKVNVGGQSIVNQMSQTVRLEAIDADEEVDFGVEAEEPAEAGATAP